MQVILEREENEHFQRQAEAEGLSLSAWLRKAGESLLASAETQGAPRSPLALKAFFETCRTREAAAGEQEPDWEEHLARTHAARRTGLSSRDLLHLTSCKRREVRVVKSFDAKLPSAVSGS